jgi:hypothetical protein
MGMYESSQLVPKERELTMKRIVELAIVAMVGAMIGVASGQSKRPADPPFVTILPDSIYGAVIVRGDPTTGEIRYRIPRSRIDEETKALAEKRAEILRAGDQAKLQSLDSLIRDYETAAAKEWLTRDECEDLELVGVSISDPDLYTVDRIHTDVESIEWNIDRMKDTLDSINDTVLRVLAKK